MTTRSNVAFKLFKTDRTDGFKRRITGGFWNTDPNYPYKPHAGVDYGSNVGEELTAYDDFEVIGVNTDHSDYGLHVFLYFPKIDKTGLYAHMDSIGVSKGQTGKDGAVIGRSGNTGKSGGPHLHFGLANGRVTNTNKGNYEGQIWVNFETYVYSPINTGLNFINETGIVTSLVDGLRVRKGPSRNDAVERQLNKGQTFQYSQKVSNDNHMWVTDGKSYVASRQLSPEEWFVNVDDVPNQPAKPAPAPKPSFEDKTGQWFVIQPRWLVGDKNFDILRRDGSAYPSGIKSRDGVIREYKITETLSEGFYKVIIKGADTSETYLKWRTGVSFR